MKTKPALVILILALAACSSEAVFHNKDGTQMIVCKDRDCRDRALKAGFIEGPLTARPATSSGVR